ncbi:Uncharacterised protein [Mycobacteroides abscessus subsp. abscessus]|nr:Uncharacterised protein [Mycobacteroides abscessus subsp. abscessus]SKX40587.1 Uncharacterised protein [Mycobacteroides abscessus subsp. abscessus]
MRKPRLDDQPGLLPAEFDYAATAAGGWPRFQLPSVAR